MLNKCPICKKEVKNKTCCSRECEVLYRGYKIKIPITKEMILMAISDYQRGKTIEQIARRNGWDSDKLERIIKYLKAKSIYQRIIRTLGSQADCLSGAKTEIMQGRKGRSSDRYGSLFERGLLLRTSEERIRS